MDKLKGILKNKYILLLIAVGLILMLFSSGEGKEEKTAQVSELTEAGFSVRELEDRIAEALSKIDGAGKVRVVLTVRSSTEQVIAEDVETTEKLSDDEIASESLVQTVIIDMGDGEGPVTLKYIYPEFQGALVIAQGAGNAAVRLALTEAVSSLTGIGADRITVAVMQS
ncbi:MAG: stage III sporulation protein AG [Ruminococcaceae bacterium]|nr:stage III sporulation protein AG [Oscillospiraceae bacterium]